MGAGTTTELGAPLLRQRHDIARAGNALREGAVEVGDHVLEFGLAERRIAGFLVGEFIDGVMHALFRFAPEPPSLVAFEDLDRPRQVAGGIPMVEFLAQVRCNDSADEKEGSGHEGHQEIRRALPRSSFQNRLAIVFMGIFFPIPVLARRS